MIVLGLTGSIAMGKSLVSKFLKKLNIPVIDLDKTVHMLYASDTHLIETIEQYFPGSTKDGIVDRNLLSHHVIDQPKNLKKLEQLLEPFLINEVRKFIGLSRRQRQKIVVLEGPLLFEKGYDMFCDRTLVVSAPYYLQKRRAIKRKNMSFEKFKSLVKIQMPDIEKKRKADYVIISGLHKGEIMNQLKVILGDVFRHA